MIIDGFSHQVPDIDPQETAEWLDSFDAVVESEGRPRAQFLLMKLLERARASQVGFPATISSPYVNSIAAAAEPWFPGDEDLERRIRRCIRWNAAVMVTRANMRDAGIGGHLSTYASSASLYEVGFNHFFRGKDNGTAGDQVYFQGHASPGIYARAYVEGRLSDEELDNFRFEVGGHGLASYPHPRLMPDWWEFPTVSMGLGPIAAIYQARFNRYLLNREIVDTSESRVWCFIGDGEFDEPETRAALSLAARERLDNLVFVVNCNLQRLDGPVRGNGKIIQELEALLRGCGWNVIKVIWGRRWDELLARDVDGVLVNKMNTTLDGDFQKLATESGAYIREHFFGPDPRLRKLVEHLSDAELQTLPRGGHDYRKLYAAYKTATEQVGAPTAILAKTIKGWTLGPEIEARNATHQIKKMTKEQLRVLRDRLSLKDEIPDEALSTEEPPYYRPPAGSPVNEYLVSRSRALGGHLPNRVVRGRGKTGLPAPRPEAFAEFELGSRGQAVSTTMAFARLLSVGSRGGIPRHQTLRAIVDWSWDLLDDTERAILRQLSVFSDGATPESAEQVCSLGGNEAGIVDVIAALVDKSLVVASGQRHVRYRLLETVRAYAAERLAEAGEDATTAARHADYFLALAERAEPELRGPDQITWLDLLAAEHDNCASAIRHAVRTRDAAGALRFVRALALFWAMRDYDSEASEWAAEALKVAGDTPPDGLAGAYAICKIVAAMSGIPAEPGADVAELQRTVRQLALPQASDDPLLALLSPMLAVFAGEQDRAMRELSALSGHPDPWVRAARHMFAGHLAINDGEVELAAAEFAAGHDLIREIGDRFVRIGCLTGLAQVALARDDPEAAVRALERIRRFTDEGMTGNLSKTILIALGWARALAGDITAARSDLEEGVRASEKAGELDDAALGYVHLGEIARREGDLAAARDLLGHALEIVETHTGRPDMSGAAATTFSRLGCVAEQDGDLAAAARWHERAIAMLSTGIAAIMPSNPTLAMVTEGIAALAAARGDQVRAAELLGLAHRLQGFRNTASLEVARAQAAIGASLTAAEAEAASARGRSWGRAEALALRP